MGPPALPLVVDPETIESKNLNRIINSRKRHAIAATAKVTALAKAVRATGLVKKIIPLHGPCYTPEVIQRLAACDVLFGCMDSPDGRDFLNRIATFYCLPYFDLGVHLKADGCGGVETVCGSVHYVIPGGSSLLSRGVYSAKDLSDASLRRSHPEQFERQLREGYVKGAKVDSPAVVSVNGLCATLAINNLLARLHPFRDDPNSNIRWQTFDLVNTAFTTNLDGEPCKVLAKRVGRGDMQPPLDCVLPPYAAKTA